MDRFELPCWAAAGWLVLTQLALAGVLLALSSTSPKDAIRVFALLAVAAAFVSASQDVVIDAYRTDLLPSAERGMAPPLASWATGWDDPVGRHRAHLDRRHAGRRLVLARGLPLHGALMAGAAVLSALLLPRLPALTARRRGAQRPARFAAVLAAWRWASG